MRNLIAKAFKNPKKGIYIPTYHFLKIFGHLEFTRFIVLTRSRTGSNLLMSWLNSHPHIHACGEIFRELKGKNYRKILNRIFSKQPRHVKAAGFKIFYYHPQDDNSGDVWDELVSLKDLHVIHLKRKNILRTLLSRKIAGKQDIWGVTKSRPSNAVAEKVVELSVEELRSGFEGTKNLEKKYERMFNAHPGLTIYYEDLVKSSEREMSIIAAFLGLEFVAPTTRLKRQNPEKLPQLIRNYEELKNVFSNTEWAPFFED